MTDDMRPPERPPVPLIDPERCTGCGLCVRVCPTGTLAVQDRQAIVVRPWACEYTGLCELICPTQAIQRPFEIVVVKHDQQGEAGPASG